MRIHVCALMLMLPLAIFAQHSDRARRDRLRGVIYELPPGWEWARGHVSRIAIIKPGADGGPALRARLEYAPGAFRQVRIEEIRQSLAEAPEALRSFTVKQPHKMRGYAKAIRVSYEVGRGDPEMRWKVTHLLARRKGDLYEWIEEVPAVAGARGLSAMLRGRAGLTFGKVSRRIARIGARTFRAEMMTYGIPIDWDWVAPQGSPGAHDASSRLMGLRTRVLVNGRMLDVLATLRSMPVPTGSHGEVSEARAKLARAARPGYVVIRSFKTAKVSFAKRSAIRFSFIGKLPAEREQAWPPELDQLQPVSQLVTRFVFKNGTRLIAWTEFVPSEAEGVVRPLLEKARSMITTF